MARPARLLGFAVLSALLVPATQFASSWQPLRAAQGKEAQVSERLRWVGDRFLNGSRAVHPVTHQKPVPLGATQIPGFLDTGDPLWLDTTQEPWDLDPLNGKDPKVELLLPADLGKTVPLTPQAGLKQDGGATLLEVEGQLEDGDQVLQDGSLYDLHTFEGEAGQFIEIRLSSDAFDTYLILVGPDGERVAENDDSSEGLNSIIQIQLLQKGRYSVFANAYDDSGRGRYLLTITTIDIFEERQPRTGSTSWLDLAIRMAERADNLLDQGVAQAQKSQFNEAVESWIQALELYRNPALQAEFPWRSRQEEGRTLGNLGGAYYFLGQYQQAIEFYQQALLVAEDIGDREGEGRHLGNLGLAYEALGQYQQALELHEKSLLISRETEDYWGEGTDLNNLANLYETLGQYHQAIELYEQALTIFREESSDRTYEEGRTLSNLGVIYSNLGQYQRAVELYQQALAIAREVGDRFGEGNALGNLGVIYEDIGQYDYAARFYQQQLAIVREINDLQSEGTALGNLGIAYRQLGQYPQSFELYQQALTIAQKIGARADQARHLSNIAKLFNIQNQPELAIVFLKASVEVREAIRGDIRGLDTDLQQSFTDTIADDYRLLADLLLQQDRILEAQRVLDLLKVQELDDYLRGVQRNGDTEQGVPLRPDEQAILDLFNANQDQLIALGRELDELDDISRGQRSEAQQARILELRRLQEVQRSGFVALLEDELVQAAVQRLRNTTGGEALELQTFDALRDNLAELEQNAVVLYPFVLDDRLELILVTPYGPPINRTVPVERVELNRVIAEFRDALDSPRRDPRPAAQQLYDWLIRPLEADLAQAEAETLIYTPDRQLRYIPLAALHDGEQWLVQQYAVNNITAASLDDLSRQPFSDGFNILAAAVTEDRSVDLLSGETLFFPGLTFAGQEVSTLAALIPGTDQRLNSDFSTDLRWEFNDYAILHLATHATFQPGVPEESFILFGDGRADLTEIKNTWSFPNVDLVVLSACETGVGDELGDGSEILGFGYLMQQAGADAAIASLWKVSDPGTQVFMTRFYQALQGGASKANALRTAQLALIDPANAGEAGGNRAIAIPTNEEGRALRANVLPGYSHPYYWAPFILIGNGL